MIVRGLVVFGCVALCGCVSVFEGTSQDLAINSNPPDATCVLERPAVPIGGEVKTPGTVTVRKSKYDITIRCNKPGYQEATYINHSGTSATIAANVVVDLILTAGISSIVDSSTGADNKYDSVVNIMLAPIDPAAAGAVPGAATDTTTAAANPLAQGTIEERLKRLQDMLDMKTITQAEYDQQRRAILAGI
jgi:hypothetical protein